MSILHRISDIILFLDIAVPLFAFDKSLSSEEGFEQVGAYLTSPLARLVVWGLLPMLPYHLITGVRHLVMDADVDETLEGGKRSSKIIITITVVLIVPAEVWVW